LVGEKVVYSAQLNPEPIVPEITFYDNGTALPGCTNLYSFQRCSAEYSQPGSHAITATLNTEEEEEFASFHYELAEPPNHLEVNAVAPGTICSGAACAERLTATGAIETWTVPAGVSRATFILRGAGGGGGEMTDPYGGLGGAGGKVTATMPVTAGTSLTLVIGEPGLQNSNDGSEVPGGYGGGGNGGAGASLGGGSGGGGSFVFAPDGALMLAAGGGGGAGNLAAGGEGGRSGGDGEANGVPGGTGASPSGPGQGGVGGQNGLGPTTSTAIEGSGGRGANATGGARSGGGGGGGYYGGGGGASESEGAVSGGGGGSDYVAPSATDVIYENGAGGPGGNDNSDPGQAGEVEILYTRAVETSAPSGPSSTEPESAHPLPAHSHLTVYTHGGQGVINSHALTVKASCGPVACTIRASATLEVAGLGRLPVLMSLPTPIAASRLGRASVPVPKALRRKLRHYLLHHRDVRVEVQLTVTATTSSSDSAPETLAETLPMWTLPGFR
jgi:hypothetical protein